MKKVLCFISIVFSFSFLSCTRTLEDTIRKEFKIYVSQNFNDPGSLKEIVSIAWEDTVSANKIAERIRETLAQTDTLTYNYQHIDDSLLAMAKEQLTSPKTYAKLRRDTHFKTLLETYMGIISERMENINSGARYKLLSQRTTLDEKLSQLDSDSTCFITYKIKTRIETHGDLSIKEYYAIIDNNGSIAIYDNNGLNNYPEQFEDAYKTMQLYVKGVEKEWDLHQKSIEHANEMLRYIYLHVGK